MKTYQSKLEAGQAAWIMRGNKAVTMPIGSVHVKSVEDGGKTWDTVEYNFRIYDATDRNFKDWEAYPESQVFATKEELLASL